MQNEIDYQVDESVQAFNDSRKSLSTLCERYENAVKIWANYRRNSDIVNEWVDDQLHSLSNLPPEEALNQVQVRFPSKIVILKPVDGVIIICVNVRCTVKPLTNNLLNYRSCALWLWK